MLLAMAVALAPMAYPEGGAPPTFGSAIFTERTDPPLLPTIAPDARAQFGLGQQVFNSHWLPAGTQASSPLVGLGPLFNAPSCDACHNDGARGAGAEHDGPVPASLVVQLETTNSHTGAGDRVYGHVLNPSAAEGWQPEGVVSVHYIERQGRYADGTAWRLREPRYDVGSLAYGPIDARTVLKPRIAPALYGVGLLEVARAPGVGHSRFGWQANIASVREQTVTAMQREMGVTSAERPDDDATPAERQSGHHGPSDGGGVPEARREFVDALVAYQSALAVPRATRDSTSEASGLALFTHLGCAGCHTPHLTVEGRTAFSSTTLTIEPYSDLRAHDLGSQLADRSAVGRIHRTLFRTAPLWGIGYRPRVNQQPMFLHDGRARSVAEAVLWHGGDAASARALFIALGVADREALERWVLTR